MNINKKYIGILSVAATILLSACSSDDSGAQNNTTDNTPVGVKMQVKTFSTFFADSGPTAVSDPTGFSPYTPDKTTYMGVYMLLPADWTSPKEEKIIYTNKWNAHFEVKKDKTYIVYGYMPKTGEMESSLTKTTADAATLTISNMKPVTTDDICIITGVKNADEGLTEGQFSWSWPITTSEDSYKIHILMDHLYAGALFNLKIDADYALLRTIKLKTMTLRTECKSVNATISLTHNTTGASPISGVVFDPSGSSEDFLVFNSDAGTALDKDTPVDINTCFAPTLSNNLTMVTTYDVYDRKGNLIRENSTATNKLPNLAAVRGQKVQVNLTVNPTYLYVLSEPDLDNPTIKIEN